MQAMSKMPVGGMKEAHVSSQQLWSQGQPRATLRADVAHPTRRGDTLASAGDILPTPARLIHRARSLVDADEPDPTRIVGPLADSTTRDTIAGRAQAATNPQAPVLSTARTFCAVLSTYSAFFELSTQGPSGSEPEWDNMDQKMRR